MVRSVPYGDADLVVGLFTQSIGQISAIARRARSNTKRLHLEPMHTLCVRLQEKPGVTLLTMSDASIVTARRHLLLSLEGLESAGIALRWVRQTTPIRTPEPEVWTILEQLLDSLNNPTNVCPRALLAMAGLSLLRALGYALQFKRCVVCERPCPPQRPAYIDAVRGGLVCRRCGGSGVVLSADVRKRLAEAARGEATLLQEDIPIAIDLVETGLLAHANIQGPQCVTT